MKVFNFMATLVFSGICLFQVSAMAQDNQGKYTFAFRNLCWEPVKILTYEWPEGASGWKVGGYFDLEPGAVRILVRKNTLPVISYWAETTGPSLHPYTWETDPYTASGLERTPVSYAGRRHYMIPHSVLPGSKSGTITLNCN